MNKSTIESRVDWTKVSKRVGEFSIFIYFSRSESERESLICWFSKSEFSTLLRIFISWYVPQSFQIGEKKKFDKLLDLMKNSAFFWLPIYKIQLGNERNSKIR